MKRTGRAEARALALVVLLAGVVRCWGLGFGLPAAVHDDEWQYVQVAARMVQRRTPRVWMADREPYLNPTGFTLLTVAALVPVDLALRGEGPPGIRARYLARRGPYHLAARALSALAGTLSVLLLGWGARPLLSARGALFAAALLAASPLHVRDSHFATNDALLTLLTTALLVAAPAAPATLRRSAGLGALLGAAVAVKYSAGLLLAPLLAALLAPRGRPVLPGAAPRLLLAALAGALAALALFPALLLEPGVVLRSFEAQADIGAAPWPGQDPGPVWLLHARTLTRALGPAGLGLGLAGLLVLLRRRALAAPAYAAAHLAFYLPLPLFFARLDLPLLPALCLGAGAAAELLFGRRRAAWAALLALALVPPAACSTRVSRLLAARDTRADLHDWVRDELGRTAGRLDLAVDPGLVRVLPLGPNGYYDPRLRVVLLPTTTRHALEDPLGEARLLRERLDAAGARYLAVTDVYATPSPLEGALVELLAAEGREVLQVLPGQAGQPVPYAQEERYGPWDHLWTRARPGPTIRVFRLGGPW